MLPSHVVLSGPNSVLVLSVIFNKITTLKGLWYPKGDKLSSPGAPQSVGGPVTNLPLHGPIAAHVWSEPTLGGSPNAPYRQGLCQVSPTYGHPPEAQV